MSNETKPKVAVLKTSPETVVDDYGKAMRACGYKEHLSPSKQTVIKLNLSWTKYFPACSSQPWQLDGVLKTMSEDDYDPSSLFAAENKTVVTNPIEGMRQNKWEPVLKKYGLDFHPLMDVEWVKYEPKGKLLKLDEVFAQGVEIPKVLIGSNILHLPTVKTHGHTVTTGSIKNSFGALLKEVRHYAHKHIHEVLSDLLMIQKEISPGIFTAMDGTVCGDGAGPRTMVPKVKNIIVAGADSVAVDAVGAKLMGYDPMKIDYIRLSHERGLGCGNLPEIEIIGEDISSMNFNFTTKRSLVIWGDQMLRRGFLRAFEKPALHSPLFFWAPLASNIYHDWLWYPTVGRSRIRAFSRTEWGKLFETY